MAAARAIRGGEGAANAAEEARGPRELSRAARRWRRAPLTAAQFRALQLGVPLRGAKLKEGVDVRYADVAADAPPNQRTVTLRATEAPPAPSQSLEATFTLQVALTVDLLDTNAGETPTDNATIIENNTQDRVGIRGADLRTSAINY